MLPELNARCRELDAQRSLRRGVKALWMPTQNQDLIWKRNLFFALVHILQLSSYFHLGKRISSLLRSWCKHRRLVLGCCAFHQVYIILCIGFLMMEKNQSCNVQALIDTCNFKQIATRMVIQYGWGPDDSPAIYYRSGAVFIFCSFLSLLFCCPQYFSFFILENILWHGEAGCFGCHLYCSIPGNQLQITLCLRFTQLSIYLTESKALHHTLAILKPLIYWKVSPVLLGHSSEHGWQLWIWDCC